MDFLYRLLFPIFFRRPLYGEVMAQTEMEPAPVTFKYKHICPKKERVSINDSLIYRFFLRQP